MRPERDNSPHRLFDNKSYFVPKKRRNKADTEINLQGVEDKENADRPNQQTSYLRKNSVLGPSSKHICRKINNSSLKCAPDNSRHEKSISVEKKLEPKKATEIVEYSNKLHDRIRQIAVNRQFNLKQQVHEIQLKKKKTYRYRPVPSYLNMPKYSPSKIVKNERVYPVPIAPDGFRVEYQLRSNSKLSRHHVTEIQTILPNQGKNTKGKNSLYVELSD